MTIKTILISGATSGIGLKTALRFAREKSFRLILTGRRKNLLVDLKKSIDASSEILCFDVSDKNALKSALKTLPDNFQTIDILVNNAGAAHGMERAQNYQLDDWEKMVDINIKGLMYLTHEIVPKMVERNQGHIINIGSIAASLPYVGGNVYGATKAFVHQFSRNLICDLLGTNLKVTTVAPGLVETDFFDVRFKGDQEKSRALFSGIQALRGEDVADAIYWAATQPPHVNISFIELMPVCQAPGGYVLHRD